MLDNIKSAFSLWNVVRGTNSSALRKQAALPFSLLIIGDPVQYEALRGRLETKIIPLRSDPGANFQHVEGQIVLDAARLSQATQAEFKEALAHIALRHADRRIVLAANVPAFRTVVANQLSHDRAYENAKVAAVSALPGIIPLTDWLLPATAAGDMFILTKNQIILLLEIAACYGRPPDAKARIKELLPVIGGAFGWRTVARELIGLVPGGIGVAVKAAVAYAGTYSVGRAAAYYYSGNGQKRSRAQLKTYYRQGLADAFLKARDIVSRK